MDNMHTRFSESFSQLAFSFLFQSLFAEGFLSTLWFRISCNNAHVNSFWFAKELPIVILRDRPSRARVWLKHARQRTPACKTVAFSPCYVLLHHSNAWGSLHPRDNISKRQAVARIVLVLAEGSIKVCTDDSCC